MEFDISINMAAVWDESFVPFLMDNVECSSGTSDFLNCPTADGENCGHAENVIITCLEPDDDIPTVLPTTTEAFTTERSTVTATNAPTTTPGL